MTICINPLSSPDRAHNPRYITTLFGDVDSIGRAQRVNYIFYNPIFFRL